MGKVLPRKGEMEEVRERVMKGISVTEELAKVM